MDPKKQQQLEKLIDKKAYKKAILLSAKKPVFFAFGGSSAKNVPARLIFDRKKKPKPLFTMLKDLDPDVGRGVWGAVTFNRETKKLEFRLEKKPITGMVRLIKLIMKERRLAIRAVIMDADGTILDEDDEPVDPDAEDLSLADDSAFEDDDEDDDDDAPAAEPATAAAEPAAADDGKRVVALTKALKDVAAKVAGAIKANPEHQAELMGLVAGVKSDIVAKDPDGATAKLGALVARLKEIGATAPADPAATPAADPDEAARKELRATLKSHGAVIKEAILARPDEQPDLMAMMAAAKEAIGSAPIAEAHDAVQGVEAYARSLIAAAAAPATPEPAAAAARPGFAAMQKARLGWDSTRKQVRGELEKLEKVILDMSQGDEDMDAIAAATSKLFDVLGGRDEAILDALDRALNAPDDAGAVPTVKSLIRDYIGFLDSDPLASEIDANPFAPVKVRSSLVAALKEMDAQVV